MRVLVLSNDLMFSSQMGPAVSATDIELETCLDGRGAVGKCQAGDVAAVVLDLNFTTVDAIELAQQIQQESDAIRLIAVGPHVHKAKLFTAEKAGWQVFTRGQFHADTVGAIRG